MGDRPSETEKVEFVCHPDDDGAIPEPKPAADVLPEWYRNLPPVTREGKFREQTVRLCPAFLDALSLGWILPLEADVKVNSENPADGPVEFDDGGAGVVTEYTLGNGKLPDRAIDTVKFHSRWALKVPDGYSALVVQPMNRRERRFEVVAQIVDADRTLQWIDAPAFWYADGARTVLREGTPLVQVIPFERESRLENAVVRPFRRDGKQSYDMTKRRTSVNRSWYRTREWTPKSTRMIDG
ncbi:hypothetical protein [Salinilacihabitans rarus]|uniref:hypothetical protein n=1 Tax=Salinilacihabitans rarus TaxID=2961596 RepID=UPI0020C88D2D|nr:hypothetical protein [Salinilacihabitans rarus]